MNGCGLVPGWWTTRPNTWPLALFFSGQGPCDVMTCGRAPGLHLLKHLAGQVIHGRDDVHVVTRQERYRALVDDDPHLCHAHRVARPVAALDLTHEPLASR
jgi:hypothetical protein